MVQNRSAQHTCRKHNGRWSTALLLLVITSKEKKNIKQSVLCCIHMSAKSGFHFYGGLIQIQRTCIAYGEI